MRLSQTWKIWLGLVSSPKAMATETENKTGLNDQATESANLIWRVHAALDAVYGKGWSKENPHTVARFLQALSTKELATEVGALREIIASGTGAITVGIEKT
jgi:hypothetical protein